MKIGVPKEIKTNEYRVGLTPSGVTAYVKAGHEVAVEHDAGTKAGYPDEAYEAAGATITDAETAWAQTMIVKVKEPLKEEYHFFRPDMILYTYLHLAANRELTDALMAAKMTAIGYETMEAPDGSLPALAPMSQLAGRMAVIIGGQFLQTQYGGKGKLITGLPGVKQAKIVIIGGGSVGANAAQVADGLGANVTILDVNAKTLADLDARFDGRVETRFSTAESIADAVKDADLVIGAVLIPGHKAPTLVTREMVQSMEPGSVVVDIPIDQGGIFETSQHATGFDDPTYVVEGVIHYAVANVPGAVPRTATEALTAVTTPHGVEIATRGVARASAQNVLVRSGLNIVEGMLVEAAVADSLGIPVVPLGDAL